MPKALRTSVVLNGGGPCGLVLANELGRRGIDVVLFNDKASTTQSPQANATQARTMEHFRRLGFANEIRAKGLPTDYPTDVAYFTRYAQHELARFSLPSARQAAEQTRTATGSWSAAEFPHRVSQIYVEEVLHRHASRYPSVDLRYGWRVVGISETDDRVRIEAERHADGEHVVVEADYLVGCDGPRSGTRQAMGVKYGGESTDRDFMGGRMMMIYFRAPELYSTLPHPKAWMYWALNGDRRAFMVAIDGEQTFVFHTQLRPGETAEDITDAQAREMFETALGARCRIEIINRLSWRAGLTLVAERFQSKRIFLGGDAAHLFTPTGGLGYNTAVDDAVNLAWKLAATVQGWGGPNLLASYEAERRPAALRNTTYARGFADSVGSFRADPAIEAETPAGAAARQSAGAYLNAHARAEFNIPGITLGTRYDGSPIIVSDGSAPPPDVANQYDPTACPGGRAPHYWFADGRSLFDLFGPEFTLLRLGDGPQPDVEAPAGLPLRVLDLPSAALRNLYGADFALVRPDQIVAWRGATFKAALAALQGRATGYNS